MSEPNIPKLNSEEERVLSERLTADGLDTLRAILARNGVLKAAVYGSVLRDDFEPGRSDIDLLILFRAGTTLLDMAGIQIELQEELGILVDVVSWNGVIKDRNPLRRDEILDSARGVYDQAV